MHLRYRMAALAIVVAFFGALVLAPHAARAQATQTIDPVPVTGSNRSGNKTFDGVFTVTRFVAQGNELFAEGTLVGTVANKHGKVTHEVEETVLMPVEVTSAGTGGDQALAQPANAK